MLIRSRLRILQPYNAQKGSTYEGLVATRTGIFDNSYSNNHQSMSRSGHVATDDIVKLKIAIANFLIQPTGSTSTETGTGPGTWTASIEYPSGVFSQILWSGGSRSVTIGTGGVAVSDYTSPAKLIPRGASFWIRLWQTNATAIFANDFMNTAVGDLTDAAASGLSDFTMGGTISNTSNGFNIVPAAIIAMTRAASVVIVGDSIAAGKGGATATDYRKGIVAIGLPSTVAFLNLASPSLRASDCLTNSPSRQLLYQYCSHAITELGVNDFYSAGRTEAQVWADLRSIWAKFPPRVKITQTTITPETSSAGNLWETDGDQTILTGNTPRVAFNTTLRAGNVANLNNGFFETALALESSHDSGKWLGDGVTVKKYTADGVHPTAAGYTLGSAAIDATKLVYP